MGKENELLDAARTGNIAAVEKILEQKSTKKGGHLLSSLTSLWKGVNINYQDSHGFSAVHHAALNGHSEVLKLLLQCEALATLTDENGNSALHLAAWSGHVTECHTLLHYSPTLLDSQNNQGDTPLHNACQYGHSAVVQLLLEQKAQCHIKNKAKFTPLQLACQFGRLDVVQVMLKKYSDLLQREMHDADSHFPLMLAARSGHKPVVELLLAHGCNINFRSEQGTALHEAATFGKVDVVRCLLEHGVDVNIKDSSGKTALQVLTVHSSKQAISNMISEYTTSGAVKKTSSPVPQRSSLMPPPDRSSRMPSPSRGLNKPPAKPVEETPEPDIYAVPVKVKASKEPAARETVYQVPTSLLPRADDSFIYSVPDTKQRTHINITHPPAPPSTSVAKTSASVLTSIVPASVASCTSAAQASVVSTSTVQALATSIAMKAVSSTVHTYTSGTSLTSTAFASATVSTTSLTLTDFSVSAALVTATVPLTHTSSKTTNSPLSSLQSDVAQRSIGDPTNSAVPASATAVTIASAASIGKVKDADTVTGSQSVSPAHHHTAEHLALLSSGSVTSGCTTDTQFGDSSLSTSKEPHPQLQTCSVASIVSEHKSPATMSSSPVTLLSLAQAVPSVSLTSTSAGAQSGDFAVSASLHTTPTVVNSSNSPRLSTAVAPSTSVSQNTDTSNPSMAPLQASSGVAASSAKESDSHLHDSVVSVQQSRTPGQQTKTHPQPPKPPRKKITMSVISAEPDSDLSPAGYGGVSGGRRAPAIGEGHSTPLTSVAESPATSPTDLLQPPAHRHQLLSKTTSPAHLATSTQDRNNNAPLSPVTPDHPPPSPRLAAELIGGTLRSMENWRPKSVVMSENVGQQVSPPIQQVLTPVQQEAPQSNDNPPGAVMRRKTSHVDGSDMWTASDMDPFSGLVQGSVVVGEKRRVKSQILGDLLAQPASKAANRLSMAAGVGLAKTGTRGSEDERSGAVARGRGQRTLEKLEEEDRLTSTDDLSTGHVTPTGQQTVKTSGGSDDDDWSQIAALLTSYGGRLTYGDAFQSGDFNKIWQQLLPVDSKGESLMQSVGDWLETIGLGQYEYTLVANGFDNTDFLGGGILDEGDLIIMHVVDKTHRDLLLQASNQLSSGLALLVKLGLRPQTVEQWLLDLHLSQYLDSFLSQGFTTMQSVQHLTDAQLISLLGISALGHRKRIQASLDILAQSTSPTSPHSVSVSSPSPPKTDSTSQGSEEILTHSSTAATHCGTAATHSSIAVSHAGTAVTHAGTAVASEIPQVKPSSLQLCAQPSPLTNVRELNIRPPRSGAITQWKHAPEVLVKGCCNYKVRYLGSASVPTLLGVQSTKDSLTKLRNSTKGIAKIPFIILSISYRGIKFIDALSEKVVCEHLISNMFCACQDEQHLNYFAYITCDLDTRRHYCHVFCVDSTVLATEITLTIGEAFEIAYQLAVQEQQRVLQQQVCVTLHRTSLASTDDDSEC